MAGGASGIWTRVEHGQEVSTEGHTRPATVGAAARCGDRSRPASDAGGVDWSVSPSFPFPPLPPLRSTASAMQAREKVSGSPKGLHQRFLH